MQTVPQFGLFCSVYRWGIDAGLLCGWTGGIQFTLNDQIWHLKNVLSAAVPREPDFHNIPAWGFSDKVNIAYIAQTMELHKQYLP